MRALPATTEIIAATAPAFGAAVATSLIIASAAVWIVLAAGG